MYTNFRLKSGAYKRPDFSHIAFKPDVAPTVKRAASSIDQFGSIDSLNRNGRNYGFKMNDDSFKMHSIIADALEEPSRQKKLVYQNSGGHQHKISYELSIEAEQGT